MANESRSLYGDVLGTMNRVGREEEEEYEVLFAGSPGMWRGGRWCKGVCGY